MYNVMLCENTDVIHCLYNLCICKASHHLKINGDRILEYFLPESEIDR